MILILTFQTSSQISALIVPQKGPIPQAGAGSGDQAGGAEPAERARAGAAPHRLRVGRAPAAAVRHTLAEAHSLDAR